MSRKAVIFSAPSGSGKTTIVRRQLKLFPKLTFSISATTRTPRSGEINGVDYYFMSVDSFKRGIEEGSFVEYEEVYDGCFYGTLKSEVERIWLNGNVAIFDVDVEGGKNLKEYFGKNSLAIFIRPPSLDILKQRLTARGTESDESLEVRLGKAARELSYEKYFDVVVLNDKLEEAIAETKNLIELFLLE